MKVGSSHNFHVPLPQETYEDLREESRRRGRPATAIARQAIEDWLHKRRRMELAEDLAEYAAGTAGSPADLDPDLEQAGSDWLESKR